MKYTSKFLVKIAKGDYFESACIMMEVPDSIKMIVNRIANDIDKDDIDFENGGIEDQCHITVLYGVNDDVDISKYFKSPIRIFTDNKITYFEQENFTVAKIDVFSDDLAKIHYLMKRKEENNHKYDYHPHITIAYLKKGVKLKNYFFPPYTWEQKECSLQRNGLIEKVDLTKNKYGE